MNSFHLIDRTDAKLTRGLDVLFWFLLILHVLPVWAFVYFPSQDGPAHIYNSIVLTSLDDNGQHIFSDYYFINRRFDPNWSSHLFMATVGRFVGGLYAEKLFLTLYLILLPLSVRYFTNGQRPTGASGDPSHRVSPVAASLLVFPFLYCYPLHMGFLNFNFSLVLFFLNLGFFYRNLRRMTVSRTLLLSVLTLLQYFTHPVSLVTTLLAMLAVVFWQTLVMESPPALPAYRRRWSLSFVRACRLTSPVFLAYLPSLVLLADYLVRSGDGEALEHPNAVHHSMLIRCMRLLSLSTLVSFSYAEFIFSILVALTLAAAVLFTLKDRLTNPKICSSDCFLFATCGFITLYFISPDELAGGSVMEPRLALFPCLTLILWLRENPMPAVLPKLVSGAATISAIGFVVLHLVSYARFAPAFTEYRSVASAIVPGSTLLVINPPKAQSRLAPARPIFRVDPLRHAGSYVALDGQSVLLSNYEAAHSYFPVQFRPDHNPYHALGPFNHDPYTANLNSTANRTQVDYVLLCGIENGERDLAAESQLRQQLMADFDLIRSSEPHGLVRLYRRHTHNP